MKLKNRIAMAPFLNMPPSHYGDDERVIKWFEARARGGAGLIMTGATGVLPPPDPPPPGMPVRLTIYDDKFIPGMAKLAEIIHSYGAKIGVQIGMGGPMGGLGPSPDPYPDENHPKSNFFEVLYGRSVPVREVTVEELDRFGDILAAASARLKKAGVDCVLLHCAHGGATLCCSFISPFYNRRTDSYGGGWENRLRFPTEILRKMRKAVGPDYPILARISADELLGKRGITLEDTVQYVVPALEQAGVDAIDVSQGSILHDMGGITIPLYYPRDCYIHNAAAVKEVAGVPVIGVGRIVELDRAEKFLQEGKADIIYLGSQLAADPDTPNKYAEGRHEDIRICIGCKATKEGECGRPCSINYDIQDEPIPLVPAETPKKVLVVGGGVAGMEAARIAVMRGHKVTLMEREPELGGMVATLALNPLTAEFRNIVDYLGVQLRKLAVDVRVCKEANLADIEELNPDVVIVAAGSSPELPKVARGKPGVMSHSQALKSKAAVGNRVVVWGFFGAELAIALAGEGKQVTLIGGSGEGSLGSDLPRSRRWWILRKLTDINVVRVAPEAQQLTNPEVLYNIKVDAITYEGLHISGQYGRKDIIPYDTLIISQRYGERKTNDTLYTALEGKVAEIHKIGDCLQVRDIKEAIWTANEVARKI